MVKNVFLSSVFEGHVEADVRVLGPQSAVTPHCSTSQENISQNGGIAGHQNLSHVWTGFVDQANQRQDQAPSCLTRAVRDRTQLRCRLCSFPAWPLESTRSQFVFIFIFLLSVKAVWSQAFDEIQTASLNLLKSWDGQLTFLPCTPSYLFLWQLCMHFPFFCLGWTSIPAIWKNICDFLPSAIVQRLVNKIVMLDCTS